MRISIGAGGTGGHVYPALATAQALLGDDNSDHRLEFFGAVGGMERQLVQASEIAFAACHELHAGPVHGVNPVRIVPSLIKLSIGSLQACFKLSSSRPRVILLTGGWANLPLALAAALWRIPIVIYLPDIEPGLTIKALQRFARRVAITAPASEQFFPRGKTVVTGYPLRGDRLTATRDSAIDRFQLDPSLKTLLVFGGSRGARSINVALGDHLERLLAANLQILHITGAADWDRTMAQAGDLREHPRYQAFPYLHDDMGLALAGADLALCRAGASTLAELPLFGLPAILVPYPYAWRYQKINADYLSERGAGLRLNDEEMPEKLYDTVMELLGNEERLADMRAKSAALAQPGGARRLADLVLEIGGA